MKKFIYLFVILTSLSACESSESENSSSDLIIGEWQLVSDKIDGQELSTECSRRGTTTFLADGSGKTNAYYEYNGECNLETDSGSWTNAGNSNYRLGFLTFKMVFSNNNNTMTATVVENNSNYVTVYNRN